MTLDDVINYYGSLSNATVMVGVTRQAGNIWRKMGHIPLRHQFTFEKLTKSKLKADINDTNYKRKI